MIVCFYANCGQGVGIGHLIRSKALADVFEAHDVKVIWATKKAPNGEVNPLAKLYDKSLDAASLLFEYDAVCDLTEASHLGTWVRTCGADWIVIDHYDVDIEYLTRLREVLSADTSAAKIPKIMLMDDHQFRTAPCIDARLAPMQSACAPEVYQGIQLVGTEHLLLRPDFARIYSERMDSKNASSPDTRKGIVICFGGADTPALTRSCIHLMLEGSHSFEHQPLTVIASDAIAEAQDLDALVDKWNTKYKGKGSRIKWASAEIMAKIFRDSRYALVSCSGVAVEAVAMQCPTVAVHWIDNQDKHAAILTSLGFSVVESAPDAIAALPSVTSLNGPIDPFGAWRVASMLAGREFAHGTTKGSTQS